MYSTYRKTTTLFFLCYYLADSFLFKTFFQSNFFICHKKLFTIFTCFCQLSTQFNFVSTFKLSLYWSKNISKSCTIVGTQQLHPFSDEWKNWKCFSTKCSTQKFRFFTILIDEKVWERTPFAFSLSLSPRLFSLLICFHPAAVCWK